MVKVPTTLYSQNPRLVLKSQEASHAAEMKERAARKAELRKKKEGKALRMINKWQRDLRDLAISTGSTTSEVGGAITWKVGIPVGPRDRVVSNFADTEKSFVTEYSEASPSQLDGESDVGSQKTTSPTTHSPEPSKDEYEKWLAEATVYKSQAEEFLSPMKKPFKDDKQEEHPTSDNASSGKPLMRRTTIKGESNEFATKPAIDLETSKVRKR